MPDTNQPETAPADRAALRDRIAALFRSTPGQERLGDATPGEIADAVLAELLGPIPADIDVATWTAIRAIQLMNEAGCERDEAVAKVADYEHRINWHTTCGSCARVLDSSIRETERAEKAEAALG
ncbi:hypothetical protein ACFQ51_52215, partial [Streptomyces kaempferi]